MRIYGDYHNERKVVCKTETWNQIGRVSARWTEEVKLEIKYVLFFIQTIPNIGEVRPFHRI